MNIKNIRQNIYDHFNYLDNCASIISDSPYACQKYHNKTFMCLFIYNKNVILFRLFNYANLSTFTSKFYIFDNWTIYQIQSSEYINSYKLFFCFSGYSFNLNSNATHCFNCILEENMIYEFFWSFFDCNNYKIYSSYEKNNYYAICNYNEGSYLCS